jgi:anti-anti-sigma factor
MRSRHGGAVYLIKGLLRNEPEDPFDGPDIVDIGVEYANGVAVVTMAGELDVSNSMRLSDYLHEAEDAGNSEVVVNVERLTFMDSTGLSVILGAHRRLRATGGTLTVVAPSPIVMRLFHVCADGPHLMIKDAPKDSEPPNVVWPVPQGAA